MGADRITDPYTEGRFDAGAGPKSVVRVKGFITPPALSGCGLRLSARGSDRYRCYGNASIHFMAYSISTSGNGPFEKIRTSVGSIWSIEKPTIFDYESASCWNSFRFNLTTVAKNCLRGSAAAWVFPVPGDYHSIAAHIFVVIPCHRC